MFRTEGMTLAALKQLVRLERCIKEAERLHPPLVMLMRKVLEDFEFDGHVMPAGDLAYGLAGGLASRLPRFSPIPTRYDPDRFAPPREEDRRTPYALIGFGGGKHRCIGLAFAYQQVKVIWSVLLRRYDCSSSSIATIARTMRPSSSARASPAWSAIAAAHRPRETHSWRPRE